MSNAILAVSWTSAKIHRFEVFCVITVIDIGASEDFDDGIDVEEDLNASETVASVSPSTIHCTVYRTFIVSCPE